MAATAVYFLAFPGNPIPSLSSPDVGWFYETFGLADYKRNRGGFYVGNNNCTWVVFTNKNKKKEKKRNEKECFTVARVPCKDCILNHDDHNLVSSNLILQPCLLKFSNQLYYIEDFHIYRPCQGYSNSWTSV